MIKNKASVNRQQSVAELNAIIVKMMHQMKSLQTYVGVLEHDLVGFDPHYDFEGAKNRVLLFFVLGSFSVCGDHVATGGEESCASCAECETDARSSCPS
jgi:hypothetical protein